MSFFFFFFFSRCRIQSRSKSPNMKTFHCSPRWQTKRSNMIGYSPCLPQTRWVLMWSLMRRDVLYQLPIIVSQYSVIIDLKKKKGQMLQSLIVFIYYLAHYLPFFHSFFSLSVFLFLFHKAISFAASFFCDILGNLSLRLWKNSGLGYFHSKLAQRQKPAGLCAICTAGEGGGGVSRNEHNRTHCAT